jgi:glutamyl-tRNA synthetase
MAPPRVRFAPSPTGYLHIGGARTALFNWLWARRHGGVFILRIEDTDRERSTKEAVQAILDGMRWLGLDWDEGPEVGGPHGPYFQMERLATYRAQADRLIAEKKAYACYCTKEELDVLRKQAESEKRQFRYPGTCRDKPYDPGRRHVVRFRMPDEGETAFDDLVKGRIATPHAALQDEVILRGDGVPLYNFGAVVDDVTMEITLVARGDDHVNNTARQIQMYRALGYPVPRFAHLPMILGSDKQRLSKRHGATSVLAYREMGFLPEALVNYLVRLGWSHGDQEVFSRDELVAKFDFAEVGAAAGVFNAEKLLWLNHHYIKSGEAARIAGLVAEHLRARGVDAGGRGDAWMAELVRLHQERSRTLAEMADAAVFFFRRPGYEGKDAAKFLVADNAETLREVRALVAAGGEPLDASALEREVRALAEKRGVGLGKVAQPVRVALSGGTVSPPLFETIALLGRAESLARIDFALEHIGKPGTQY